MVCIDLNSGFGLWRVARKDSIFKKNRISSSPFGCVLSLFWVWNRFLTLDAGFLVTFDAAHLGKASAFSTRIIDSGLILGATLHG